MIFDPAMRNLDFFLRTSTILSLLLTFFYGVFAPMPIFCNRLWRKRDKWPKEIYYNHHSYLHVSCEPLIRYLNNKISEWISIFIYIYTLNSIKELYCISHVCSILTIPIRNPSLNLPMEILFHCAQL